MTLDMLVGTVTPITMTVVLLLAPMVSIWSLKRDSLSNLYFFSHTKKFFFQMIFQMIFQIKKRPFSSVLSCEDLLISSLHRSANK